MKIFSGSWVCGQWYPTGKCCFWNCEHRRWYWWYLPWWRRKMSITSTWIKNWVFYDRWVHSLHFQALYRSGYSYLSKRWNIFFCSLSFSVSRSKTICWGSNILQDTIFNYYPSWSWLFNFICRFMFCQLPNWSSMSLNLWVPAVNSCFRTGRLPLRMWVTWMYCPYIYARLLHQIYITLLNYDSQLFAGSCYPNH